MSDASTAILRPNKRFDFHAYRAFRDAYELELAKSSVHCLVIDLQEVQYIDSAALGILLLLRDKAQAQNKTVEIRNLHGVAKDVLEIANFSKGNSE
ncbi:STAS domain-containing protein [Pseudomonas anguilliseptica]|uniref:Anti-anti-sigma factor n=1 Tax=Pseudomonas anguilliseptica TaxID=53406 RepID=A0A1H4YZV0_PSEAG|nr:STAS domain-containing protein [Pseudomonas anguilliseptica]SED22550.1 anti-anti-sigma factor [Pseudomonas anguilliseptica]